MAWQTHKTWQAGSGHTLVAFKSHRSGEGLGVRWGRCGLGAAIHCRLPKLCGSRAAGGEGFLGAAVQLPVFLGVVV